MKNEKKKKEEERPKRLRLGLWKGIEISRFCILDEARNEDFLRAVRQRERDFKDLEERKN
jgi:hypothetical protein